MDTILMRSKFLWIASILAKLDQVIPEAFDLCPFQIRLQADKLKADPGFRVYRDRGDLEVIREGFRTEGQALALAN